ncbi:MAG: hypothetical protein RIR86_1170 [Acidobacteriota bacterium]|jgi:formyl-CoA transferase/CoA:oxalate CoA-transferase
MEKKTTDIPAALTGLRVLDFSHALAGPYCTLILAEYGAEVYKVESPAGGDMGRGWGPPFLGGESAYFLGLNRGKLGVSIDLKRPEGIALCRQLVAKVDVLIENFRRGTMDRLGLGYAATAAINQRLIYCSISGYGQNGPAADEAAMDLILQASSGLISMTGTADGQQVRSGYSVADITAGLFATIGILMALQHRTQTGRGQFVDVSMFDSLISAMSSNYATFLGSMIDPRPMGTSFPTIAPYRCYAAADRSFAIAAGSERLWLALCEAIGRSDLSAHPDYRTNSKRVENRQSLDALLEEIFRQQPAAIWIERLNAAGIPCALVRTFTEVLHDPQSAVRDMFPTLDHPRAGRHRVTGAPVKFSLSPGQHHLAAPLLGQQTRRVLKDLLHLEDPQLEDLFTSGVLHEPPGE